MDKEQPIIIVSGLPRSGTSMMMKMLAAGGIEVLTDRIREADENNPEGYFEFEAVKKLKEGQFNWIDDSYGKAVKIIAALITYLPGDHHYKVIFMKRNMAEILSSQRKMLERMGKPDDNISDETLARIYENHMRSVESWLSTQANIDTIFVNYNEMLVNPEKPIAQIHEFLGRNLNLAAMAGVINKNLYRERK
jgi:plasmid maintenance system antidote protein VapI